jgi:hypothetical protein
LGGEEGGRGVPATIGLVTEREFLVRMDAHLAVANQNLTAMREEQATMWIERRQANARSDALLERIEREVRLTEQEIRLSRAERAQARAAYERLGGGIDAQTAVLHDLHREHLAFRDALMGVDGKLEDLPRPSEGQD